MRLRSQNLLSITIFSILFVIIVASVYVTSQQTAQLNNQQTVVHDIQTLANNLQYLSNDYFLYEENTALTMWQTEYNLLSLDLSKLSVNSPEQQIMVENVKNDSQLLNNRWTDVTTYLENADRNVSIRVLPAFQAIWSRMSLQNQALIFDTQQLSQSYQSQIDQLNSASLILIFVLLGVFGAYFVTFYLITFRNTLKSISELQSGIAVIGSGNLDHTLKAGKKDEIDEISLSINQMMADLRTVTASKNDLEKLVEERTKQLKDTERLAAIGATAGMVGHDIRNPLQAITGDLYLVKTELEELPDHQQKKNALESLDEIQNNIDYINKIVADLQDYARPLNPRAQETNIKSIINEIVVKNGIPINIKLTVEVEDKAERIMADPDYLKRIVSNLTLNAVQAMPNGGKLTIRAYTDKKTNDVLITVKDTGVGIPEDVKPKLFTPMVTTKSKGQGFGLAVVKRMTEGLGGTVTFESTEGVGTTFIVRLPSLKS